MDKRDTKKISVKDFSGVFDSFDNIVTVKWNGIDIQIKKTISLQQMMSFVDDIKINCYDSDTGEYRPEVMDIAIRRGVLTRYANFSLPKSIQKMYDLMFATDAYDIVVEHINTSQLETIISSAIQKIEYEKQAKFSLMNRELDEVLSNVTQILDMFAELADNISPDDIERVSKAMSEDGNIDYKALIDAYSDKTEVVKD